MRDIFEEIFDSQPLDPTEAARRNMRPLRKRFYEQATVGDGNAVLLDGKPVRTPARRPLAAPNMVLAQAIADEWNAQDDMIDPATMPLTRLANAIIDGVALIPIEGTLVHKGERIDWILLRGKYPVRATEILTHNRGGQNPSDHFPLAAWLTLP